MGGSLQRTYECLLLLLLAVGFTTLASTGRLGWPVVAIGAAALAARLVLFWTRRRVEIPAAVWLAGLLLYAPVFALDVWVLSHSFLQASLHFVVLAGAAKTFGPRRGHDDLTLGVLAFLEVLTAALLTVSGVFFVLFVVFLGLLLATLVAHEMVEADARAGGNRGEGRTVPPFLRFSFGLSAAVAGLSLGVFFLLPRTAFGAWGGRPGGSGLTGFSDEVQLGAIARLQRSDRPVMHIRLTGQPPVSPDAFERIPWRGRGLTDFDGQRWTGTTSPVLFSSRSGQLYDNPPLAHADGSPAEVVSYQVTLEPMNSSVLFFPSRLLSAATRFPVLALDRSSDTLSTAGANTAGTSYSGTSDISQPGPDELRHAPSLRFRGYRSGYERRYLELPEGLDDRIPALARRIVAGTPPDDYDRLEALTRYLQTHYQYSLDNLPQGNDPLAAFLFDSPSGDCEYFASALAVMARSLDIPVRLVNGFMLGSYNSLSGEYLVRGRDAHTWVEAQFLLPSGGAGDRYLARVWVPFDATPPSSAAAGAAWPGGGMVLDALSSAWQEWIVNYDWLRQAHLASRVQDGLGDGLSQAWSGGSAAAGRLWQATRSEMQAGPGGGPWRWGGMALLGLGLAGADWRRRRLGRHWRLWPRRGGSERQRAYRRFQAILRRTGVARGPADTARDLLGRLAQRGPDASIYAAACAFVEKYEVARFGPGGAAPFDFQPELAALRRQARHWRAT